jgi:hypothetical protein
MIRTTISCLVPVVFLLVAAAAGLADARDFLSVVANAPAVPLVPRDPGRDFVRLPALEFKFEIHTYCADSRLPESLSLNVADTRKSLRADKIVNDGPTEISLKIPASQIAPLVVEDFCIVQLEENGDRISAVPMQITIPAALSAQASLLCASDEDEAMTYVSRTLDVSLVCNEPANDNESTVE